jgi:hypothetical protein
MTDNTVRLSDQLLAAVTADFAKLIVDVGNDAIRVGFGNDAGFVNENLVFVQETESLL